MYPTAPPRNLKCLFLIGVERTILLIASNGSLLSNLDIVLLRLSSILTCPCEAVRMQNGSNTMIESSASLSAPVADSEDAGVFVGFS